VVDMIPEADYDGAWKEAIETYLPACLALLFPAIHEQIDWSQPFEFLDTELRQVAPEDDVGPRMVDKLIKVWRRQGRVAWVMLHIEIQHQQTADFDARMFRYYARLRGRFNTSVVSVAILGDDHANWRPTQHQSDLWGCEVSFRFPVVKLLDYRERWAELEGSDNPFAGVVMAHLRALETRQDATRRRHAKVGLVRWLYGRGYHREDVRQLLRFIDWLLQLPLEVEQAFLAEVHAIEEEQAMPYIPSYERIAMEDGLKQGLERGVERGLERGLEQGLERGKRAGLLLGLQLALELKFGDEGQHAFTEVQLIEDVATLEVITRRLRTARSLDELRAIYQ